jgi:3'-phosphoadenosine 5'-phosphosulfate (PAPS) 3'-phosphatase
MPDPTPEELLAAALDISASAAAIPMRYFRSGVTVEDKADQSPVTIADRQTEEHITRAILARFPITASSARSSGARRALAR